MVSNILYSRSMKPLLCLLLSVLCSFDCVELSFDDILNKAELCPTPYEAMHWVRLFRLKLIKEKVDDVKIGQRYNNFISILSESLLNDMMKAKFYTERMNYTAAIEVYERVMNSTGAFLYTCI